ncbi:hemolysin family protein [Patescibacteria group bacterium]
MINLLLLILFIIFGSAFFSGLEAALFAVPLSRVTLLKEQKKMGALTLFKIKTEMSRPITVIVIFNNLINIIGSIFVGVLAVEVFGSVWLGTVSAVLTFLIIIFGEIIPKTIGENNAEKIGLIFAPALLSATKIFAPAIWLLEKITHRFAVARKIVSEEELQMLSRLGHLEGSIEEDEKEIIEKVFTMNDLVAKDIMTPRTVVVALEAEKTLVELEEEIYHLPNSRLPVYSENIDNIVGVCHRQDLLIALGRDEKDKKIEELSHKPLFVSELIKSDKLLPLFQKQHFHMAVVTDEFGGTSGVVTLEDVLEILVGEIVDETDECIDKREGAKRRSKNFKENHDIL